MPASVGLVGETRGAFAQPSPNLPPPPASSSAAVAAGREWKGDEDKKVASPADELPDHDPADSSEKVGDDETDKDHDPSGEAFSGTLPINDDWVAAIPPSPYGAPVADKLDDGSSDAAFHAYRWKHCQPLSDSDENKLHRKFGPAFAGVTHKGVMPPRINLPRDATMKKVKALTVADKDKLLAHLLFTLPPTMDALAKIMFNVGVIGSAPESAGSLELQDDLFAVMKLLSSRFLHLGNKLHFAGSIIEGFVPLDVETPNARPEVTSFFDPAALSRMYVKQKEQKLSDTLIKRPKKEHAAGGSAKRGRFSGTTGQGRGSDRGGHTAKGGAATGSAASGSNYAPRDYAPRGGGRGNSRGGSRDKVGKTGKTGGAAAAATTPVSST